MRDRRQREDPLKDYVTTTPKKCTKDLVGEERDMKAFLKEVGFELNWEN